MRSDIFEHRMVLGTASIPYLKPDLEDIKDYVFDIQPNSDVKIKNNVWGNPTINFCGICFILVKYQYKFNSYESDNPYMEYEYKGMGIASDLTLFASDKKLKYIVLNYENLKYHPISYTNTVQTLNGYNVWTTEPTIWVDKTEIKETKKEVKFEKLSNSEKLLIDLVKSIIDKNFSDIFYAINEYRISQYNKGKLKNIKFPFHKIHLDGIDNFLENIKENYQNFSNFKKYCDFVFFYLDK